MAQVPVSPVNVAQVHQALDVPAAPVQAPQGDQPVQQDNPNLDEQIQAPPIEALAADMAGIVFSGIWSVVLLRLLQVGYQAIIFTAGLSRAILLLCRVCLAEFSYSVCVSCGTFAYLLSSIWMF